MNKELIEAIERLRLSEGYEKSEELLEGLKELEKINNPNLYSLVDYLQDCYRRQSESHRDTLDRFDKHLRETKWVIIKYGLLLSGFILLLFYNIDKNYISPYWIFAPLITVNLDLIWNGLKYVFQILRNKN